MIAIRVYTSAERARALLPRVSRFAPDAAVVELANGDVWVRSNAAKIDTSDDDLRTLALALGVSLGRIVRG